MTPVAAAPAPSAPSAAAPHSGTKPARDAASEIPAHAYTLSAAADFEAADTPPPDALAAEFAEVALLAAPAALMTSDRPHAHPASGAHRDSAPDPADDSESRYGLSDMDPDSESERDMEPDLDPDLDPDDPEAPMAIAAPAAPSVEPESLTVPPKESPASLPAVWPSLVAEFMSLRPLLGSNLRVTRLEWRGGETPELRVVFLERSPYSLIEDDADFRKSIQGFLASKVKGRQDYPVRFSLDPEAAAAGAAADAIPVAYGPEDPAKREPIINFIKDIFEARQIG